MSDDVRVSPGDQFRVVNPFVWTLAAVNEVEAVLERTVSDGYGGERTVKLVMPTRDLPVDFVRVKARH